MAKVEPGTARWDEIWAQAESLREDGKLNYVNLKASSTCGGDVAQRILAALNAASLTGVEASTGQANGDTLVGKLPPQYRARWDACAIQQHLIAVEALEAMHAEHATRQKSESTRHHAEARVLRVDFDAALDDVRLYSERLSHTEGELALCQALALELQSSLTIIRSRSAQDEASLTRLGESLRETEAAAHADRTAVIAACARAESDAQHWCARAEAAEAALSAARVALDAANIRAARLEGERDAGLRIQEDLRMLVQRQAEAGAPRATQDSAKRGVPSK